MRKDDETTAYQLFHLLRGEGIPQLHVLNVLEYVYVLYNIYISPWYMHVLELCVCVYICLIHDIVYCEPK